VSKRRASLADRPLAATGTPRATDTALLGAERGRQEILDLLLREIMPNRFQPRTRPNTESLNELADSIRQHGVLEPVLVRPIPLTEYAGAGCRYELIAGERRWRASMLADQTTIPARVLGESTDDRAMLELAITENLQREDLHPLDEAAGFGQMHTTLGYSYAQIAERLGKSKGYVQNRMRLLQLDADLRQLVADRPDTLGHVYELTRVTDATERAALIAAVRDDALSRAATRARVQALLDRPVSPLPANDPSLPHDAPGNVHPATAADAPYVQPDTREDDLPGEAGDAADDLVHAADPGRAADAAPPQMFESPAPSFAPTSAADATRLTARERSALNSVAAKIERILANPTRLSLDDLEVLGPLTLRLNELLRQVGMVQDEQQDQADASGF
jgi:ParB family chromosome partitioning protein